jgi:hypothetical protein
VGEVSRIDDALWHRQTIRTPGGDAGPESAANPSKPADLLGFAALTTSLNPRNYLFLLKFSEANRNSKSFRYTGALAPHGATSTM